MDIKVVPLGAGQDVGRSCVLVTLGGKTIMFDCGIHMAYNDERRYPDFKYISRSGNYTNAISAVIITHFHLDHCGALPYFTEVHGYHGPIYMTHPTKALLPLMLEDFRKVLVDRLGENEHFSSQQISHCMRKVTPVDLMTTVRVDDELEIRAYYAGHVLGAAMFYAKVGGEVFGPSVLYTGDYNMTPDRHLGAASVDRLQPDLLITESTYATTVRDSKRTRERDFLQKVHDCVLNGGKVLIPVFALGRAQELAILVQDYWDRMGLTAPVYFSAGLTTKANAYYRLFINWTNPQLKATHQEHNIFDFKCVQTFDRGCIDRPGPCVLFASPGMLHAGMSLEVFKSWCTSEKNMVILPGYCVAGTVGNKLCGGHQGPLEIDKRCTVDVQCQIRHLSFSAHADAKGIVQLIRQAAPRNVLLVHGEKAKMDFLKAKITSLLGIACYNPPNGHMVSIPASGSARVDITDYLKKKAISKHQEQSGAAPSPAARVALDAVVLYGADYKFPLLLHWDEVPGTVRVTQHGLMLGCQLSCPESGKRARTDRGPEPAAAQGEAASWAHACLDWGYREMRTWFGEVVKRTSETLVTAGSFQARIVSESESVSSMLEEDGETAGGGSASEQRAASPSSAGAHEPEGSRHGEGTEGRGVGSSRPRDEAHRVVIDCRWDYADIALADRAISILQRSMHCQAKT